MSLFEELKRRNVFRVAIAYILLGWAVLQGADFLLDLVGSPEWVIRTLAVVGLVGFPFAVFFAWAYELTPEGLKREEEVDRNRSITPLTGKKLDRVIIGLLALAVALLLVDRLWNEGAREEAARSSATAQQTAMSSSASTADELRDRSIAVLPFKNMSADPDQEYFSDGITEEIINALVGVPGVKVAARTSVFAFKDRNEDIRSIGKELGVTHVVEGSVRSDGQQLRITAQLIQAADGFHLWSETFDRQRVNVFAIQEEIAAAIAGELNEQLGDEAPAPEVARISVNAYDDYLRGRALLRERDDQGLEQARELFEAVVAAHPDYAPGWASLAITTDVLDDNDAAEEYALHALELDPDNVDALTALGAVYRDTRRWAEAEKQFAKAIALDPDSAELLEDYGEFLGRTGRMDALLDVTSHGFAVDPYLAPLVEVYAIGLMGADESERAIAVLESATQRSGWEWLNGALASAYIQNRDEAALRRLISTVWLPDAERAALLGVLDRPDDAAAAAELVAMYLPGERNSSDAGFYLAETLLLYRGRTEPLIDAYTRQIADHGTLQSDYWFLPAYAPLRAAPGFPALLEQSGLPDYWDQAGWPDFCRREGDAIICR